MLEAYLGAYVQETSSDWVQLLPWVELWYTCYHSSIQMTTYQALYGREPPGLVDYVKNGTLVEAAELELLQKTNLLKTLKANLLKAQ